MENLETNTISLNEQSNGLKRGRPKGKSTDKRSFGPLGDLIRQYRIEKGLGLLDVANACDCSVQFVSNIEHGRAPLPWDKAEKLAQYLNIPFEELQAANLAIRSDFKSFLRSSGTQSTGLKNAKGVKVDPMNEVASLFAFAAQDMQLREVIQRYQSAPLAVRKKFIQVAKKELTPKTGV